MAKNRIQPYGYRIVGGKTTIELQEAEIVRRIYREYAAGMSYLAIAGALTESGIHYMPEKPTWNKNMIARILQNRSYAGENKYPPIINAVERRAAELAQKPYTLTEPQDIKALKPLLICDLCGEPVRRRLKTAGGERWYCPADVDHISTSLTDTALLHGIETLQKRLSERPRLAMSQKSTGNHIDLSIVRLQNEIDLALSKPEPDLAEIQQSVLSLATQKYALAQDSDHNGESLTEALHQLSGATLNSELLKHITAQIRVNRTQVTAIVLKNGTTIQPKTAEKGAPSHD